MFRCLTIVACFAPLLAYGQQTPSQPAAPDPSRAAYDAAVAKLNAKQAAQQADPNKVQIDKLQAEVTALRVELIKTQRELAAAKKQLGGDISPAYLPSPDAASAVPSLPSQPVASISATSTTTPLKLEAADADKTLVPTKTLNPPGKLSPDGIKAIATNLEILVIRNRKSQIVEEMKSPDFFPGGKITLTGSVFGVDIKKTDSIVNPQIGVISIKMGEILEANPGLSMDHDIYIFELSPEPDGKWKLLKATSTADSRIDTINPKSEQDAGKTTTMDSDYWQKIIDQAQVN